MRLRDVAGSLSYEELAVELARYTYRPGWELSVYRHPFEGPVLRVVAQVADSYHPDQTTELRINSLLPPMPDAEYFGQYLVWRLGQIESHESREWLKRDAKALYDPHVVLEPESAPQPEEVAVLQRDVSISTGRMGTRRDMAATDLRP